MIWYGTHNMKPDVAVSDYGDLKIGCDGLGLKSSSAGQYRIFKYEERTGNKYPVVVITADKNKKLIYVDVHIEGEGSDEPKVGMKHARKLVKKWKTTRKYYVDGKFDTNGTFAQLEKFGRNRRYQYT